MKGKILVVDDDPGMLELIKNLLTRKGYDVISTAEGSKVASLLDDSFDLVISDIVMPEVDGMEVLMHVRRTFPKIPLIAISGGGSYYAPDSFLEMAERLGASATIGKPFDLQEFVDTVESTLGL